MSTDYGIESDYFLFGIELGIIAYDDAIAWADSVIEKEDEPSGEIIDLALSRPRGRNGVMDALKDIKGERNPQASGAKLFGLLLTRLNEGEEIKSIASKALGVSWASNQPEDITFECDRIDDEISLAEQGVYGSLAECKRDLQKVLSGEP